MPFVRNPFRKQDENARPTIVSGGGGGDNVDVVASKPIDIGEKEPAEYKLSEINDSGLCLPPSPVERKSFWGHTNSSRSTTSSNHRSLIKESEQFNISRESFDSYRRSFDISGRSPVLRPNESHPTRVSLDSRSFQPPPRLSTSLARPPPVPIVPPTKEEDFEDVGLDDPKPQQPKKRGLFARLTDAATEHQAAAGAEATTASPRPNSSHERGAWHHFGGRKRGQSGQGAELGSYPPTAAIPPKREETPRPVEQSGVSRRSETPRSAENAQAPSS